VEQFNKAVKLFSAGNYKKAIPEFYKLNIKESWINLGLCYRELGKYEQAEKCLQKARVTPFANGGIEDDSISLHNIGAIAYILRNDEVASQYFLAAYNKDKTNYEAGWNYGSTRLRMFFDGKNVDLLEAWSYYDFRFKLYDLSVLHENLKLWNFVDKGNGIVLLRDQGMGDTIMFARYIKEVEKYFDTVYVQCDPSLECLFDNPYNVYSQVEYAVPMCSLGKLLDYVPNEHWLTRWNKKRDGPLKVGCVWQGSTMHSNDKNRSCPAEYFDALTGIEKYTFEIERPGYAYLPSSNWQDTIYNLNDLDLVITVDTAIGHMCGTLGMPCWILLPLTFSDYRWGTESSTIWYDSVKIVKNNRNWNEVFKTVQTWINTN
jgi:tetratricopeptide (TPR) repeat protein